MEETSSRIGLIAGSGPFPLIFSRKARKKGYRVYAVGYHNETDPLLSDRVEEMETIHVGQIKRLIKFFKRHEIKDAVMIGAINKPASITELRPDLKAISLFAGMKRNTHDDNVLRTFANALEEEGIFIRPSTFLLPELLADEGCWTKRRPSKEEELDIELGWRMAKAIGELDIGQCVVVSNGTVLAVEAVDGTDSTIRRGGSLARGNAVVVKVCKPIQDFRFDVPAVGPQTIQTMKEAGLTVLAVEAEKSLVFEKDEMVELADLWRISILALKGSCGE